MFDPTVPTCCECDQPGCTARLLDGQRLRTIIDPATGATFVHPEDVVECMNAAISQILAVEGPAAAAGLPLTLGIGEYLVEVMTNPRRHVPAGHVFATEPAPDDPGLADLLDELSNATSERLDEALRRILDEG
jgi:hypothetical protein